MTITIYLLRFGRVSAKCRRARRRLDIQRIRKSIKRGVCPCEDVRIENPGPNHLPTCAWHPDNDDTDCRNHGPF